METKKVIEQEESPNLIVSHTNNEVIIKENVSWQEPVIIEKSKAREVALAICPELESELKEAVELIEVYTQQNQVAKEGFVPVINDETYSRSINFLTKHKKH